MTTGLLTIGPLTTERAIELLEKAVELKGSDYRDNDDGNSCCNVYIIEDDDGNERTTPGCIVGTALHLAGLDIETVFVTDPKTSRTQGGDLFDLEVTGIVSFAETAGHEAWAVAQGAQDNGKTWGEALHAARAVVAATTVSNLDNSDDISETEQG